MCIYDLVRQQELFSLPAGDHVILSLAFSGDAVWDKGMAFEFPCATIG